MSLKIEKMKVDIPTTDYNYDRLKATKQANRNIIKNIKYEQSKCSHDYQFPEKYTEDYCEGMNLIDKFRILCKHIVIPRYVQYCKKCGKAHYFYVKDEAYSKRGDLEW